VSGRLVQPDTTAPGQSSEVHLDLQNCGGNYPIALGSSLKTHQVYQLSTVDGTWSGTLYRNDEISCNGSYTTWWHLTYWVNGIQVGPARDYVCSQASCAFDSMTPLTVYPAPPVPQQVPTTGARTFTFNQPTTASTWTMAHNFAIADVIASFYDLTGKQIYPDTVTETDSNTLTATFLSAQAGRALIINAGNFTPTTVNPNYIVSNPTSAQSIAGGFDFSLKGRLLPMDSNLWDLGSNTLQWRDGWFGRNVSINGSLTAKTVDNVVQVDGSNYTTVAAALAGLTGTQNVVDARGCLGTLDLSGLQIPSNVTILLGPCTYTASTTVQAASRSGFRLVGMRGSAATPSGTVIKWTGSAGGFLFEEDAPQWSEVSQITFDCNSLAARGWYIKPVLARGTFDDVSYTVTTRLCTSGGLYLGDQTGGDPNVSIADVDWYGFRDYESIQGIVSDINSTATTHFYGTHIIGKPTAGSTRGINIIRGDISWFGTNVVTADGSGFSSDGIEINNGSNTIFEDLWVESGSVRCINDITGGAATSGQAVTWNRINCSYKDGGNVSLRLQSAGQYTISNSTLAGSISVGVSVIALVSNNNAFQSANKYVFDGGRGSTLTAHIADADGTVYDGQITTAGTGYNTSDYILSHPSDSKIYLNPNAGLSQGNVVDGFNIHPLLDSNGTLGTSALRYQTGYFNTLVFSGGSGSNATMTHSNAAPRTYTFPDVSATMTVTIGTGNVTTAGTAVGAGTSQAQTGITVSGALTSDSCTANLGAALPATWQTGIQFRCDVTTAGTVTVNLMNPSAGSITPAATQVNVRVTR
jgi:hypothetical protein